jgi:MFS family permease
MARSSHEKVADSPGTAGTDSRGFMAAFNSLRIHDFRFMWFGQVSSATALHADILARSWLTWQLTGSTVSVVLVNLARTIPMLMLGIFAGVIADRFDKKKILLIIQAWTIAVYVGIAAVVLLEIVELWHVYAYSLLIGFGFAVNQPVRMSFIPRLVGKDNLLNALSLSSIAINSTRLGGPAVIGFLIAFTGIGSAFVISAVMYAVALWTTTRIRTSGAPAEDRKSGGSVFADLLEGFRYLGENRLVLVLVILALGPLSFGHSWTMLLPQFVDKVLHGEAGLLGVITSIGAVGGLSGGLFIASRGNIPHKGTVMIGAGLLYGVALMLFGLVTSLIAVIPLVIMIGVSQTVFRAANTSTLLESAPDRLRGRIVSVTLLDTAMGPLAGLLAGIIADRSGVSAALFTIGVICFGIVALVAVTYPKIRNI